MADKVSRRLSYDPTPNMAGLFSDNIPPAPAPVPAFAEGEPSLPPAPSAPRVSRTSANVEPPVASSSPPISAPSQTFYEAPEHKATAEEDYRAERTSKAAPRAAKAPKAPRATPRQKQTAARTAPVVSSEARIRRTLRIPRSFDKKLRELASLLGANLNSAILAAIEAEWQRRVAERRRA